MMIQYCKVHSALPALGAKRCSMATALMAVSSGSKPVAICRFVEKQLVSPTALVIERDEDGKFPEWITDVDGPVWYQCGGTDDLLESIFAAIKARADQVGEPG